LLEAPPLNLCFDRSHLHQVLWNLVSNAIRHSSRGPGAVRIQLESAANDGRVELHIFDDGPGIPETVREQIFEPFFTTHTQGTGLGLFIARELCATNGASLDLAASTSGAHFIVAGRNDTCLLPELNGAHAAR
jgi:two-component system, NtrC family, sensor histidine kinase PilS